MPRFCLTFVLVASLAAAADMELQLPDHPATPLPAAIGKGAATVTVDTGTVRAELAPEEAGQYLENWHFSAVVWDYTLPQGVDLPLTCRKLSLAVKGSAWRLKMRVLIRDARGGVWAVNTRIQGLGVVPRAGDYEWIETYRFDQHEIGRLEPWTLLALDPAAHDFFDAPQPPFQLVGFRFIVLPGEGAGKLGPGTITIGRVLAVDGGGMPDPYWALNGQFDWSLRLPDRYPRGRFGWGPGQPGPFLRADDLGVGRGKWTATYEVLAADDWTVERQGSFTFTIGDDPTVAIPVPLLEKGLHQLRLNLRHENWKEPREFYRQYLVLRNSRGAEDAEANLAPKPLLFSGPGNVFADPAAAGVTVTVAPGADVPADARIAWRVDASDGAELRAGTAPVAGIEIDLADLARDHAALWVTARLMVGETCVDVGRRVLGVRSPAPVLGDDAVAKRKFSTLGPVLRRTKGDWAEGHSPVAAKAEQYRTEFGPWLDDARDVGYNLVEFGAPWYDLNPLPGVYQFAYLDAIVRMAAERGLSVILRVHPRETQAPRWLRRDLQMDENGLAHGLWQGGANLTYTPGSRALRDNLYAYLEALAAHYRDNPAVLGYTVSNLFFDHGWHDMPWLGQNVGYSEAARRAFVRWLRSRYGDDLAAVAAAHGRDYNTWEDIAVPPPHIAYDRYGRLQPSADPLWLDWATHKVEVLADFRVQGIAALRRGDPACEVGIYRSTDVAFSAPEYTAAGAFIAQGSMENQFPPKRNIFPCRYEPHGKVARTAPLVDVGLTNLLWAEPGYNSFFNYWKTEWQVATAEAPIRAAEDRLRTWFAVVDRLLGARQASPPPTERGAYLYPLSTLVYVMQHTFSPRLDDYLKPFLFQADAEKLRLDDLVDRRLDAAALGEHPWFYVPYAATALTTDQIDTLAAYVRGGGRLVVEATSGLYVPGEDGSNRLGAALGLPEAVPTDPIAAERLVATPVAGDLLADLPVAVRTRHWDPPIASQPTPWIHNIPRTFLRPCKLAAPLPAGAVVLATANGQPIAYRLAVGKGQVIAFVGVVDWLACPGLARRLDNWGCGRSLAAEAPADPELFARAFTKDKTVYLLGRRFLGHAVLSGLKQGREDDSLKESKPMTLALPVGDGRYRVRELVQDRDYGVLDAAAVRAGVALDLHPGEGFLVEAVPAD